MGAPATSQKPPSALSSSVAPALASPADPPQPAPIWWSNAIFFVGMHLLALAGIFYLSPARELDTRTMWLCFTSWQLATFGITLGYHRLWSHRSIEASFPLRVVLAGMGCLGFQGSIKWWVLRHRLHHRFTDTESDPYDAKLGLYHSHMGWIFRKPDYPRMALIDRKDLNADPVVRFQHKHYLPLTLGLGLVAPALVGWSYGDALGGFIWGGIIARILIWQASSHCTFFINSLAHYLGDQSYSEDVTARGNFFLALFTGGEANHNYHHAFPRDYRNGPRYLDWDPTKWTIFILHHFTPFVPRIHQTPESEILKARSHVLSLRSETLDASEPHDDSSFALWSSYANATPDDGEASSTIGYGSSSSSECDSLLDETRARGGAKTGPRRRKSTLPVWTKWELVTNVLDMDERKESKRRPLVLLLEGYAVDATAYASEHPGGMAYLREYAVPLTKRAGGAEKELKDSTAAFEGGLNDHGWSAREKMRSLRIAKVV